MPTYYVKTGGSDGASGLSDALAWATIARVNTALTTINAGDSILFNRGNTFYGTIEVDSRNGTSGNPITLGAYGTGLPPVISAFTTIPSWSLYSTGIYSYALSAQSSPNILSFNNVNTAKGAYPNGGWTYMTMDSTGASSLTDNSLPGTPSWNGAEVFIRNCDWVAERKLITDHVGGTLTFVDIIGNWGGPAAGNGYFLLNDLKCLDDLGDWCYRSGVLYMYFGAGGYSGHTVKLSTLDRTLRVAASEYIIVDGISFEGGNGGIESAGNVEFAGSSNCTIRNSTVNFSGCNGVSVNGGGSYVTIDNCIINDANGGCCVYASDCSYTTITNNSIHNSGNIPGHLNTWGGRGIITSNHHSLIQYNRIVGCGNDGVQVGGDAYSTVVDSNFIDTFCTLTNDGGGIYTQAPGNTGSTYMTFSNNIILNGMGFYGSNGGSGDYVSGGIYLDAGTNWVRLLNNTIAYCANHGIKMSCNADVTTTGNNLFDNNGGLGYLDSGGGGGYQIIHNMTVTNNDVVVKNNSPAIAHHSYNYILSYQNDNVGSVSPMGTINNNRYAKPIVVSTSIRMCNIVMPPWSPYYWPENDGATWATWRSLSNLDQSSIIYTGTVSSVNEIHFFYNDTKVVKNFILSNPMVDIGSANYSGTVQLQPFTSKVLLGAGTVTEDTGTITTASIIESASAIDNQSAIIVTATVGVRLNAVMDNFWHRGQVWYRFWMDAPAITTGGDAIISEVTFVNDSRSAILIAVATIAETGIGNDARNGLITGYTGTSEPLTVIDNPSSSKITSAVISETGTLTESPSASKLAPATITEGLNITDNPSTSFIGVVSIVETGIIDDTSDAGTTSEQPIIVEATEVLDSIDAFIIAITSITENLSVVDIRSAQQTTLASMSEPMSVTTYLTASKITLAGITETLNVLDLVSTTAILVSGVMEGTSANASQSTSFTGRVSLSEGSIAIDEQSSLTANLSSIEESSIVMDFVTASIIMSCSISEKVTSGDVTGNGRCRRWTGTHWVDMNTMVVFR